MKKESKELKEEQSQVQVRAGLLAGFVLGGSEFKSSTKLVIS